MNFEYRNLNIEQTFTKIYVEGKWGSSKKCPFYSGVGSHNKEITYPYIKGLTEFLKLLNKPSLVDAGCGDFNIGKNFINLTSKYYAYDVVENLINYNSQKFKFEQLIFEKKDITKDKLPNADVIIVRLVLQHLSNQDILNFLKNIENKFNYLILTEHYMKENFTPNKNKVRGSKIRLNSGIVLHKYPFNMKFIEKKNVLTVNIKPHKGSVNTIIYKF